MESPTQEQMQIAMMASQIFTAGQHSAHWSVRYALQIWQETADQLKEKEKETKQ